MIGLAFSCLPVLLYSATATLPAAAISAPQLDAQHTFICESTTKLDSVALVGSFNDWNPETNRLTSDSAGQTWHTALTLPFGVYDYQYIVNGQTWTPDPQGGRENDGHGKVRSTVTIGPANPYKAPLYWSSYEYNLKVDGSIPEKEWAANLDWVEKNLKPYGYDRRLGR